MKFFGSLVLPLLESVSACPYPFDSFIIALIQLFVKEFSKLFLLGKWKVERAHENSSLPTLRNSISVIPLTIIIIANSVENTSGNVAQNYGKNFVQPASHFSLDKLCEVWYNEKLGASRTLAPRPKNRRKIKKQEGQPLFAFKIS